MKILCIGLGSVGQRHLRNIRRLMGNNVQVMAYRVRGLSRVFDDNLNIVNGEVAEKYNVQEFYDLQQALNEKPDAVIISNPSSMHMETAIAAAQAGADLFIEKPISNKLEGVEVLKQLVKEKNLKVYVGFQNRLHPCLQKLHEICTSGKLGQIASIHCEIGELLTKMHQYDDYRTMTEASKKLGGGAVISQCHELDYLCWIFGLPKEIYSIGGKNSHLKIDVEDHATTLCRFQRDGDSFSAVIHQDFLQSPPTRNCKVVGEYGHVEIDLLKNICTVCFHDHEPEVYQYKDFVRNDMFMQEMKLFLDCVNTREKEFVGLDDGIRCLKLALAIKESMETDKIVKLQES